jgi:putative membrane protein
LKVLQSTSSLLPTVNTVLSSAFDGTTSGAEGLKSTKEALTNSQNTIHDAAVTLKDMTSDEKLDKVFELLKNSAKSESEFLASPVDIKTNEIYHIPNYGYAMTPFYTVLAIWVGCLILVSLLSTHIKDCNDFKDLKAYEIYFARLLTFLTIALAQALVVTLGDLFVLKIYCVNKLLFVLVGLFASFIFCIIVYTLTSTFGDVGKAMSVILLVLQVAGSGGTFPIEVTPLFFRIINPLLPFTYAISAMRETVGGIYWPVFTKDVLILLTFLAISFFIALVLKKKLMKVNEFFEEKMEETGLM